MAYSVQGLIFTSIRFICFSVFFLLHFCAFFVSPLFYSKCYVRMITETLYQEVLVNF